MGIRRNFRPTNIVTNGNFANGTTGWININATSTVVNNRLSNTGSGAAASPGVYKNTGVVTNNNNKYYARAKVLVTNNVCTQIRLRLEASAAMRDAIKSTPEQNIPYILSGIFYKDVITGNLLLDFNHYYADAATANGKVMEVQQVLAIDLTALFGAGNEPTEAWCDLNIPNWFDGTMSGGRRIGGIR